MTDTQPTAAPDDLTILQKWHRAKEDWVEVARFNSQQEMQLHVLKTKLVGLYRAIVHDLPEKEPTTPEEQA